MKPNVDKSLERFKAYENETIEMVILHIKRGQLKAGQYANLVKLKKGVKFKK